MAANGYLTTADLAPITGGVSGPDPGQGQLANPAAAAWNAAAVHIHGITGQWISVNGPDSAYRPYSRQVYWRNYWCSLGHCENAAVPGTSNHGIGMAADVPDWVGNLLENYGGSYGWRRACSDAPWENWHWHWCGGWSGPDPGPYGSGGGGGTVDKYPTLKQGSKNHAAVKRAQRHLDRWNKGLIQPNADGVFGDRTRNAVREFQAVHGLHIDGVIGKKTWHVLRRDDVFENDERWHINRVKWWRHAGTHPSQLKDVQHWCTHRAKRIWRNAQVHGWEGHMSVRFKTLKKLGG